jgi:hypothetical protein
LTPDTTTNTQHAANTLSTSKVSKAIERKIHKIYTLIQNTKFAKRRIKSEKDDADTTGFDLARWSMVSASAFSDFILSFANGVVSVSAGFLGNRRALD